MAALREAPTFEEYGIAGIGLSWVGVFAPRGTPEEAVDRLNRRSASRCKSPEIRQAYAIAGRDPVDNLPKELAAWIRRDMSEWRQVIRSAGIRAE